MAESNTTTERLAIQRRIFGVFNWRLGTNISHKAIRPSTPVKADNRIRTSGLIVHLS
jgi:hypothetical protein